MISIPDNGCYCFTLETIDTVDIFTKPRFKQIIVHSLNHFISSKGLVVYGWSLMSNKLYIICQAQYNVSFKELINAFTTFTCNKIIEAVADEPEERKNWLLKHFEKQVQENEINVFSCWGKTGVMVPVDINRPESMADQLEFIHNIPVKERTVQYPTDYLYSSARDYASMPGLVKIVMPASVAQILNAIESRKSGFKRNCN